MEYTLVIIKPDGVEKNILQEVLKRFSKVELKAFAFKVRMLDKKLVMEHYSHLLGQSFYPQLEQFMMSGPVITMIVSGENAVFKVRQLVGPTNPLDAPKGTIRGDFGDGYERNVIHSSDSIANGIIEIKRFYEKEIEEVLFEECNNVKKR